MMTLNRKFFFIPAGIFILGIIFGSLFDNAIAQAIFSDMNPFATFMSSIGTAPIYFGISFCCGGIFISAYKNKYKTSIKVILFMLVAVAMALVCYFNLDDFTGENGFMLQGAMRLLGIIPITIINATGFLLGYFLFKKREDQKFVIFLVLIAVSFAIIIGFSTLIKLFFSRPRYRALQTEEFKNAGIYFVNWWQRFNVTEEIKQLSCYTKDAFKAFPSGHAGSSATAMAFGIYLPLIFEDQKNKRLPLIIFLIGLGWNLLIAWNRMWLGAHFLSDVSFGGLISLGFTFITTFIVEGIKKKLYPAASEAITEEDH